MSELKKVLPCPFCGEELEVHCTGRYYMHKINGCVFQRYCFETDDMESIEKWNTRKPMQNIVERLEEVGELEITAHSGRCNGKTLTLGFAKGIKDAIKIVKEEGGTE